MRLLKASSIANPNGLELTTFSPNFIPPYAILSHTWGHDEVLYDDVVNCRADRRAAFQKCNFACEQTLADGLEFLWIDTCCIDKSSSAELSEAINSMFEWYRGAVVCYAYLEDYMAEKDDCGSLKDSKWFTRGWTLQELLAPKRLLFYAAGWNEVGTKEDFASDLASFTHISAEILNGRRPLQTASIANRMGWAARRETTRPEDLAYCLMGIFDVNMPLLYGEGMSKAFFRLQEEIMKDSGDHTLFAWADTQAADEAEYGMLAPSPRCFASTGMLLPYQEFDDRAPHAWTSKGLLVELQLTSFTSSNNEPLYQATLNCPPPDFEESCFLTIYLKRTNWPLQRYARVRASRLGRIKLNDYTTSGGESSKVSLQQIYVKETNRLYLESDLIYPYHYLVVDTKFTEPKTYKVAQIVRYSMGEKVEAPPAVVYTSGPILIRRGAGLITAAVHVTRNDGKNLLVTFGSTDPLRLAFDARQLEDDYLTSSKKIQVPSPHVVKETFKPHSLGEIIELEHHRVRAELTYNETDKAQGRSKYYRVKLHVDSVKASPSWTMDRQAEMGLKPQVSGKSSEKINGKSRLKSFFGNSSKAGRG